MIQFATSDRHRFSTIGIEKFATKQDFDNGGYGLGDGVFMIGRFIAHDGRKTNVPSVGFGNISIPPSNMTRTDGFEQLSFGVEMRSMQGNSGSPVFTFTEAWDMETNSTTLGAQTVRLLGVDWGQIVHPVEVREHIVKIESAGLRHDEREAKFIKQNTGMNGVVPAWKLLELLNRPEFVEARNAYERDWIVKNAASPKAEFN